MKQHTKIAVLGGGGRTGKYLVTQLLLQGYSLKLLLRHPEDFTIQHQSIEIIKGDAIDPEAIRLLLEGCSAIISTVGQRNNEPLVSGQSTVNILKSMALYRIQRFILLAGINVDTPFDKKSTETSMATEWMKTNFPLIHADRQKTYSLLTTSEVDWTLVRVPFIEFTDSNDELTVSLEDCHGNRISANSIATFMTGQLTDRTYYKKSPFISKKEANS
jgi:putative NADH-flavin reductase